MATDISVGESFQLPLGEARAEYSNVDDFLSIVSTKRRGAEIVFSCIRKYGFVALRCCFRRGWRAVPHSAGA